MRVSFLLNLFRSWIFASIIRIDFLFFIILIGTAVHLIDPYLAKYIVFVFGTAFTSGLCRLLGVPVKVDKLKSDKPMLVIANHSHEFDTIVLTTAMHIPSYIAKKSLSIFLVFDHFIFLNRNGRDLDFLKQAEDRVRNGQCVVIFPEGTRVKQGEIKPYSKSLALLARRLDIPVALYALNVGKVIQKYKGFTSISFGKTIHVKQVEIVTYGEVIFKQIYARDDVDVDVLGFRLAELNQTLKFLSKNHRVYEYLSDIASPWVLDQDVELADLDTFLQKSAPFDGIDTAQIKSDIIRGIAVVRHINTMSNSEKDTLFTRYAENTIRSAVDALP